MAGERLRLCGHVWFFVGLAALVCGLAWLVASLVREVRNGVA